jgi:hypothetical protein
MVRNLAVIVWVGDPRQDEAGFAADVHAAT